MPAKDLFLRALRRWFVAVAAVLSAWGAAPAHGADAIAVSTFFSNEEIREIRISPSGHHLALTVPATNDRMVLAVVEVGSAKPPVVVAASPRFDIYSFEWVNDERLVYEVADLLVAAFDQKAGLGLFTVKRDGSDARALIRGRWIVEASSKVLDLGPDHRLLRVLRDGSNDVIVVQYIFNGIGDAVGEVPKRLDVTTGHWRSLAVGSPPNATDWVFDPKGEPRAVRTTTNGVGEVFWRDSGETWRSILKAPHLSMPWEPEAVDGRGNFYAVVYSSDSTASLARVDRSTGKPEKDAIVLTPGFDGFSQLVFDSERGERVLGVRVETDAATTIWFDPEVRKLQALADARFPNTINQVSCGRCWAPEGAILVRSFSDRDPGTYSVYRPSSREWTTIGRARPAVDPKTMATLDMHRIKARDGLDLPVWVTTPREVASGPRPAVVLVHGGPWVRGTHWHWNADAQFLASRGYVVIEPEFRGSTGYGRAHMESGFRQWGTTMQDDVADAVRWATAKGLVDGKRICIAGASYGGYATLMGVIRYPDLYRCGVAWVAVSDPRLLLAPIWQSDMPREAREYSFPIMIGDPEKDADMLKAAAPVERAREIKVPMLLAYGAEDVRVPIDHGDRIRAAMRASGNEPEYIVYPGEGHGWLKVENRIDFWTRVEKFLAKNLK
ncbi:MAG TPA: prolyl oligopeptidase family serine peptidase [Caldimonas sp.]|jgi:dienelactone hydrolase